MIGGFPPCVYVIKGYVFFLLSLKTKVVCYVTVSRLCGVCVKTPFQNRNVFLSTSQLRLERNHTAPDEQNTHAAFVAQHLSPVVSRFLMTILMF